MSQHDVRTMNLADSGDGMVSLQDAVSTTFIAQNAHEKNLTQSKGPPMDSTPISDIMPELPLEPPMMDDPRAQQPIVMTQPMMQQAQGVPPAQQQQAAQKKNPFNLNDEQWLAVIVAACTAGAISKPVQEKLANFVPQFLNDQGHRSMVGLITTGAVAASAFYIINNYA